MKFECLKCGKTFLYPAIHTTTVSIESNEPLELHVCPYCKSLDIDEISEKSAKIVSVACVDLGQVDQKILEGYEVRELYAKTTTMVKKV